MIEFRNVDNLDKVVRRHSVAPHKPGRLCTIPPSTLVFEDKSSKLRTIYKLDCSGLPLYISNPTLFIGTELKDIWDMSFTQLDNTQLVLIAGADKGLFAP